MSDTDERRPRIVVEAPAAADDVEDILQRLRAAEDPLPLPNVWRDAYARDVRRLLDRLGGGEQ